MISFYPRFKNASYNEVVINQFWRFIMNVRQYVFGEAAVGMAMGGGATVTACVGLLCLATGKYGHALGMFVTTGCILYPGALAHIQLTEELLEIN